MNPARHEHEQHSLQCTHRKCLTESCARTDSVSWPEPLSLIRSRKQPSVPFCMSRDVARCRDWRPWYHLPDDVMNKTALLR